MITQPQAKVLSLLTAFALVIGLLSVLPTAARADSVTYQAASYDDTTGVTYTTETADNANPVSENTTTLVPGWFYVKDDITIADRITVIGPGEVNLILVDGKTLTASKGINVSSDCTLNIYGQTAGTGEIKATGISSGAAIGATKGTCGTITIHGGTIEADGSSNYAAGIGGGGAGDGGNITIHGGTVTAKGAFYGSGIGGGGNSNGDSGGSGGTITINGGSITATSGKYGTGIGGGYGKQTGGAGGTITINGGSITATGGEEENGGAGIGGGPGEASGGAGGNITIKGGTITAKGGKYGAGIGGGGNSRSGGSGATVTINGGCVIATGGEYGAGIGGGNNAAGGSVTISGGSVTAAGYKDSLGAGIGGGSGGAGGTVKISGGIITASGADKNSQGIGGAATMSNIQPGTLEVSEGLTVYGGSTQDPTTVLTDYATNRPQYMRIESPVKYVDITFEETTEQLTSKEVEPPKNFTFVKSDMTTWGDGWHLVNGSVEISNRIIVTGEVNLILLDWCTLTAKKGINVSSDKKLNIYGQSRGTGTIKATGDFSLAGIGGGKNGAGGTITIHGGTVNATGGYGAAGIGGGASTGDGSTGGSGGTIIIYSGTVNATGGSGGAAIGGGDADGQQTTGGSGGTIRIHGGTVNAKGGYGAAGIGGGTCDGNGSTGGSGGNVSITGGTVTATGSSYAAGIGGGGSTISSNTGGSGGTVSITGGTVNATGGEYGAGIGGGNNAAGGSVTISGGMITATGGNENAHGIGTSNSTSDPGSLTIDSSLAVLGGSDSENLQNIVANPQTERSKYLQRYIVIRSYVSFSGNASDAAGEMEAQDIGTLTLPANVFTRAGYTFKNWNTKPDGSGESYEDQATATFTTNTTLYAQWEAISYTITYDLKGGSVSTTNPTTYTAETATFKLSNPTKAGYDFAGWTGTDLADKTAAVTIPAGSLGDRTYTANFSPISYKLTYELYGGTNNADNPSSYTIESATITLKAPTRDGYDFGGWTLDGETITEIPTGSTGDKTLTALWTSSETDGGETGGNSASGINVEIGTPEISVTSNGDSRTSAKTVFKTNSGNTILTANLAITTASDELKATVGTSFDTTVSVDVTLDLVDTAYTKYAYSMDVTGLPTWLKVSGEITSNDSSVKSSYRHTFRLTGTPSASSERLALTLKAVVKIFGSSSSSDLISSVDKTITLTSSSSDGHSETPSGEGGETPSGEGGETPSDGGSQTPETSGGNSRSPSSVNIDPYADSTTNRGTQSDGSSDTPSDTGGNTGAPLDTGGNTGAPLDTGGNTETPSDSGNDEPSDTGGDTETPEDTDGGVTEIPSAELQAMTDEEITSRLANTTDLVLTGEVSNLSETIARIERLTSVKTLDLSQVTGVSELKLTNTTLESISLEGNQSITTVEISGNETLTTLNLTGSNVETVNVEGCTSLTTLNVAGSASLTALNVKATKITALDVNGCSNLTMVDAKGCEDLESVNLEGCESLEYLDVSETKITELDANNCSNLGALYCSSCELKEIRLEGCENLSTVDCSYNHLPMFNASGLTNLGSLRCEHQRIYDKPLSRLMNFLDLLFGRGIFGASAVGDSNGAEILENVGNLKAYDASGNELSVNLDRDSGEAEFSGEPAIIGYDYDTGFEDVMMDVEVYPSEEQDGPQEEDDYLNDPECSGCSSGFEIEVLGVLMLMLVLPRKRA